MAKQIYALQIATGRSIKFKEILWIFSGFFGVSFLFATLDLKAQTDTTIFAVQKRIETTEYIFSVPDKWRKIDAIDQSSKDRKFEFSEVSLPKIYNNSPVTALFSLRKYVCDSARAAEDYVASEITSYPDRITPPGKNYERDTMHIESGEKGVFFSTHFYRRTKISNYTRYDLVVYSKKRKAAYMLNITFQYKDPTYGIEKELKLKQYTERVFKTLSLR